MSDITLLSVRCTNVSVVNLGTKGTGFLSRMLRHATASADTAVDIRWVTISQSKPYPIDGRASEFVYDQVYESEKITGLSWDEGIYPQMVASIKCPADMDCNIRLNIHIQTVKLNTGKPIILCGCTFSRKDLIDSGVSTYNCRLSSEFCVGAKAFVKTIDQMSVIGANNSIEPYAPVRLAGSHLKENTLYFPPNATDNDTENSTADDTKRTLIGKKDSKHSATRKTTSNFPNPMVAQYVFYDSEGAREDLSGPHEPIIHMNEMIFEPKRLTDLPVMVFENFKESLVRSLQAWRTRRQLEVMRQGIFKAKSDALSYGWHEIKVTVVEADFECLDSDFEVPRPYSYCEPLLEDNVLLTTSDPASNAKDLQQPSRHSDQSIRGCRRDVPALGRHSDGMVWEEDKQINTAQSATVKNAGVFGSWAKESLLRTDLNQPSTYINLSVHDEKQIFDTVLGRTNTEYYQKRPVYGSNAHASSLRNPQDKFNADAEGKTRLFSHDAKFEFMKYTVTDSKGSESRESNIKAEKVFFRGTETCFQRFIPSCEDTYLVMQVNLEPMKGPGADLKGKSPILGVATVPLSEHMNKDIWVPIEITNKSAMKHFPHIQSGQIHVEVSVESPAKSELNDFNGVTALQDTGIVNELSKSVPAKDSQTGKSSFRKSELNGRSVVAPSRMPFSSLYYRDYTGRAADGPRDNSDSKSTVELPLGIAGRSLENTISDGYEWLWYTGYFGKDPLIVSEAQEDSSKNTVCTKLFRRADIEYPIPWIDNHILDLEAFQDEVLEVLDNLQHIHNNSNGNCFRASVLKKDLITQPLATNCHMQMVTIKRINRGLRSDGIIDSITSGCFTAHALGHKKGGLYTHQLNLDHVFGNITKLVNEYDRSVQIPHKQALLGSDRDIEGPSVLCISRHGEEEVRKLKLLDAVLSFESSMIDSARRRILVMSQILSVAVNVLLFKLALLEEGYVRADVAEQWMHHGFPIIFESLLSVSGHERSMLEDTIVAVDLLQLHRFRIRVANEANYSLETEETVHLKAHKRLRHIDPNTANINLEGREIIVTLPKSSFEKFPASYIDAAASDQLIIYPISVLFTQGLDFQQTYENVMGSSSSTESSVGANIPSSMALEHEVNKKAIDILNDYCHIVKPREEEIHPWVATLESHVRYTGKAGKDWELLMEVQKLCYVLGGGKVTFCKSGKDRTGMVITLEQSRILGERFQRGTDSNQRLLHDADLMREYGPRLQVCEKSIGKAVYSINKFQTNFLPETLRPPRRTMEDISLFKSDNT
eukprot:GSChrysophyteH1.ASY1.ANO1.1742.1 assembled CDS